MSDLNSIIIAVSGSIASYKACELVRSLVKKDFRVSVIMTENASHFIGKTTFEALSNHPVLIYEFEKGMAHIEIKNSARVFAVVPATANIIGKMANGIADDLVTSTYLACTCPILIAPSMNPGMYSKKVVQRNIHTLKEDGVIIVEPSNGAVVCGDVGYGKLAEISEIEKRILELYETQSI